VMTFRFDSSPDGVVTATTILCCLLLGVLGGLLLFASVGRPTSLDRIVVGGGGMLCLIVLAGAYVYCPRRFVLTEQAVVVRRPVGDVTIPLRAIRKVQELPADFAPSWRMLGSGGLFGVFGRFESPSLGRVTIYGRRSRGGVMLQTDVETIVLRPDEPPALASHLSASMTGAHRTTGEP